VIFFLDKFYIEEILYCYKKICSSSSYLLAVDIERIILLLLLDKWISRTWQKSGGRCRFITQRRFAPRGWWEGANHLPRHCLFDLSFRASARAVRWGDDTRNRVIA